LFPTTVVRPFFFALPPAALGRPGDGDADPSVPLAHAAAGRAARRPFAAALDDALDATARALGLLRHRVSGRALAGDGRACGGCAFAAAGRHCLTARTRLGLSV